MELFSCSACFWRWEQSPNCRGSSARGHCQLNWATGIGSCSINRGTGSLAGIHVVLSEWVDFAGPNLEDFVFHLNGTYHVE